MASGVDSLNVGVATGIALYTIFPVSRLAGNSV
jgi:tRNA G18 (ribose-2'-O)-methylase SpoU